jgi:hypothetical protein
MRLSSKIKNPYGLRGGKLINISVLNRSERGLACGCLCPHCRSPLIARMGTRVIHHFAHQITDCGRALESALHRLGKTIITKRKELVLPEITLEHPQTKRIRRISKAQRISFDQTFEERPFRNGFIPDITLYQDGTLRFVEILVTHRVDRKKLLKIRAAGVSTIELDLRPALVAHMLDDQAALETHIIESIENKKWLFNARAAHILAPLRKREAVRKHRIWTKLKEVRSGKVSPRSLEHPNNSPIEQELPGTTLNRSTYP